MDKSILQKVVFAAVACAMAGSVLAKPTFKGESSTSHIKPTLSGAMPFGADKAGIQIDGKGLKIALGDGPVKHVRAKYNGKPITSVDQANKDPKYLTTADVNKFVGTIFKDTLGQVWYEKHQGTEVVSVRQIADSALPVAPKFGGLVIAQVPNLPADTNVFFGEWAPRKGNAAQVSTDLNMSSNERTVWYSGENLTTKMPNLTNARYDVVGVNQHTPGKNDLYRGVLTANYANGGGDLKGSIARTGDELKFTNVKINNKGGFAGNDGIQGQFFGKNADALAGIATRGTDAAKDDIAFGGKRQ